MAKQYHQIVTPVGRIVGGSFDQPRLKDGDNKDLQYKDGTLAAEYSVLLAIPKTGEQHWNQTAWGAQIWNIGDAGYPGGFVNRSDFSWKIQDGDSAIPNKKGKKNCDREGYPGHWVIAASRRVARDRLAPPQYVDIRTNPQRPEAIPADAIKHGYYAQLCIQVSDNAPSQTPGVYVNLEIIALAAFGQPIILGTEIDASQVGFGGFALPAGAMTTPPAGLQVPNAPAAAAAPAPAPVANSAPAPAAPAPVVTPNHAFAAGGAPMAPPPAAAPAPAPAPARQMTAAAQYPYEAYISSGWTDVQLIANGLMVG